MKKFSAKTAVKQALKKLVHPGRFFHFLGLVRRGKPSRKAVDDAELNLYAEILTSGYLHYGYFTDPDIAPDDISLKAVEQAQVLYAELLVDLMEDRTAPVLDVGCGWGGLVGLLRERGFDPVALTPNRAQIENMKRRYPDVTMIEGKFEAMPFGEYEGHFGTVVTSESLQYLKLDKALPILKTILKPDGRWVVCDYFRIGEKSRKSGHRWDEFLQRLGDEGWRVDVEVDITKNILPTLASADMWGRRLGLPLFAFAKSKMKRKSPGMHYLLEEPLDDLQGYIKEHLEIVNPEIFAREKKYVRMVIQRADSPRVKKDAVPEEATASA